jgi:ribonuclease HII
VVAAAAVLPAEGLPDGLASHLGDSKKLSARRRDELYEGMCGCPGLRYGIGQADESEIDRLNILKATHLAMERAVAALPCVVDVALVDGNRAPPLAPDVRMIFGEGHARPDHACIGPGFYGIWLGRQ